MQYSGHAQAKILFVSFLKSEFNQHPIFLFAKSGSPTWCHELLHDPIPYPCDLIILSSLHEVNSSVPLASVGRDISPCPPWHCEREITYLAIRPIVPAVMDMKSHACLELLRILHPHSYLLLERPGEELTGALEQTKDSFPVCKTLNGNSRKPQILILPQMSNCSND